MCAAVEQKQWQHCPNTFWQHRIIIFVCSATNIPLILYNFWRGIWYVMLRCSFSAPEQPVIEVGECLVYSELRGISTDGVICPAVKSNRAKQSNLKQSVNVSYPTCTLSVSLFLLLITFQIHYSQGWNNVEEEKLSSSNHISIMIHAISDSASLFIALLVMAPSPLVSLPLISSKGALTRMDRYWVSSVVPRTLFFFSDNIRVSPK